MYLATLSPSTTPQEVFNHYKEACVTGTFPAYSTERLECRYRTECKKHACAIGIFIPDEGYYPGIEGHKADGVILSLELHAPSWMTKHEPRTLERGRCVEEKDTSLAECFQNIHDFYAVDDWNSEKFLESIKKTLEHSGHIVE